MFFTSDVISQMAYIHFMFYLQPKVGQPSCLLFILTVHITCIIVTALTITLFNGEEIFRFIPGISSSVIFSLVLPDPTIAAKFCFYVHRVNCHLFTRFGQGISGIRDTCSEVPVMCRYSAQRRKGGNNSSWPQRLIMHWRRQTYA